MRIYFLDQEKRFLKHLEELKAVPVMRFRKDSLREKVTTLELSGKRFADVDQQVLMDYHIFPPYIMSFLAQWSAEGREMRVGDTIVQQVFLPPHRLISQKIIFGVRVNRIFRERTVLGFSYDTLDGHVERGESSFTLEETAGGLRFIVRTFSEPSNNFVKWLGPFFALPYQKFCTKQALRHVKSQLR